MTSILTQPACCFALLIACGGTVPAMAQTAGVSEEAPVIEDKRLVVELFAEQPEIVTPTGITVDRQGRVFVAESHTHFRPDDYAGPPADRILVFEDTDGDGRADKRSVFHEGFTHVMDIEFHADGALYVATRMDIHRMKDTDGDGRADCIEPVVVMETTGTYPHNGISGLAFDVTGWLRFGLGENLGHDYTLRGTDGIAISGGGEGGTTYRVRSDGTQLRRISTGWWNPFGLCVDSLGRTFGTDNDPGASPPCRLIQVVDDADYGYEYRYGRTGLHPLITWTGELPGTLPMIAGTGEAPCAVISYESDALSEEYYGDLLVASWADHRIERYRLAQPHDRGLVSTQRAAFVVGDNEFRPVGLAVAPDGTVLVSDWVSASYELHGLGRIWRIRPRDAAATGLPPRPSAPATALRSRHRVLREAAARTLVTENAGREVLRQAVVNAEDARVRATALQVLAAAGVENVDYRALARQDAEIANRVLALRHILSAAQAAGRVDAVAAAWAVAEQPAAVRAEALRHLDPLQHPHLLKAALDGADPLLVHAAIEAFVAHLEPEQFERFHALDELATLLALKRHPRLREFGSAKIGLLLESDRPAVRLAAIKWIADDQLVVWRPRLEQMLQGESTSFRNFLALSAALDRLDGKTPEDRPPADRLIRLLQTPDAGHSTKRYALQLLAPPPSGMPLETFTAFLDDAQTSLRLAAIRTLSQHPATARFAYLTDTALDATQPSRVRAFAVTGLSEQGQGGVDTLLQLARDADPLVQAEALRGLVGAMLQPAQQQSLRELGRRRRELRDAVSRVLVGTPGIRPPADDVDAWLALLDDSGDPRRGELVFFGSKVGMCGRCHRIEGRGNAVGPDLSRIHRRLKLEGAEGRRWLVQTVLQPSRDMAPQYTPWMIVTTDGKTHIGLPRRKGGSAEAYLGEDGQEFTIQKRQIEFHREMTKSLMPEGLLNLLTRQELNDLLAFITRR